MDEKQKKGPAVAQRVDHATYEYELASKQVRALDEDLLRTLTDKLDGIVSCPGARYTDYCM